MEAEQEQQPQPQAQGGEPQPAGPSKKSPAPAPTAAAAREKRERKAPEVFKPPETAKAEFKIQKGAGEKLRDIPNVQHRLSKLKADDDLLQSLHNAFYKRPGKATTRKRDVLEFSGYVFEGDEGKKEEERIPERLGKLPVAQLNQVLDIFDLPRGAGDEGKKESKVQRLFDFLKKPVQLSEKDIAAQEAKKKEAAKRKREKSSAKKATPAAKKGKATKKKGGEEEEEEDEEEEESEAEEPPKKKAKKETPAKKTPKAKKAPAKKKDESEEEEEEELPKKKEKKETPAKKTPKAKKAPAKKKEESEEEQEEEEQEGEEGEKEGAEPMQTDVPSDEQLLKVLEDVLKDADPASFSLNEAIKKLHTVFPSKEQWLEGKRLFIKDKATVILQSRMPAMEEEKGEVEAEAGAAQPEVPQPPQPPKPAEAAPQQAEVPPATEAAEAEGEAAKEEDNAPEGAPAAAGTA